jgi:hypothetical protein
MKIMRKDTLTIAGEPIIIGEIGADPANLFANGDLFIRQCEIHGAFSPMTRMLRWPPRVNAKLDAAFRQHLSSCDKQMQQRDTCSQVPGGKDGVSRAPSAAPFAGGACDLDRHPSSGAILAG